MGYRVVSTSPSFGKFVTEPVEHLRSNGCAVELRPELKTEDLIAENLGDADAVLVGFEPITAKVIAAAKKLRVVAKHGAGVDNIDIAAATKAGVVGVSAAGVNSEAVAESTIGLFLALARSIPMADKEVRAGGWPRFAGLELAKKTVGIVGFGQIGRLVAARLSGFDMKVLAHDAFVSADAAKKLGAELVSLDRLLAESDFVSLHIPLTKETRGLIGADQLKRMKKSAFLVNVSRGGTVDEQALYEALKAKVIGGAALDVFEKEPLPADSPLRDERIASRLRLFPHVASAAQATRLSPDPNVGMAGRTVQAVIDVLEKRHDGDPKKMPYVVNKEAF